MESDLKLNKDNAACVNVTHSVPLVFNVGERQVKDVLINVNSRSDMWDFLLFLSEERLRKYDVFAGREVGQEMTREKEKGIR